MLKGILERLAHLSVSEWVAWWGAIIATVALVWNIMRDVRRRGRLKLEAMYGVYLSGRLQQPSKLTMRITNIGTEPIVAQGIGADRGEDAHDLFTCTSIPRRLEPGEFTVEIFQSGTELSRDTRKLYVWDSKGKKWLLPKKRLRELLNRRPETAG